MSYIIKVEKTLMPVPLARTMPRQQNRPQNILCKYAGISRTQKTPAAPPNLSLPSPTHEPHVCHESGQVDSGSGTQGRATCRMHWRAKGAAWWQRTFPEWASP